jgi:hypothetical protein
MFGAAGEVVGEALERVRETRRCRVSAMRELEARLDQELTQIEGRLERSDLTGS